MNESFSRRRVLIVAALSLALFAATGAGALAGVSSAQSLFARPVELDAALACLATVAVTGVLAWLSLSVLTSLAAWLRSSGPIPTPRFSSKLVHRSIGVLLGVGIAVVPVAAQAATPTSSSSTASTSTGVSTEVSTGVSTDDPRPEIGTALSPGWGVVGTPAPPTPAASPTSTASPTVSASKPAPAKPSTSPTSPVTSPPSPAASRPIHTTPDPGWVVTAPAAKPPTATPPERSVIRQPRPDFTAPAPGAAAPAPQPEVVVVHRGDTLWAIAAAHLDPGASNADIAAEWPRWYEANRDVIGSDPDLILPGQQLVVPEPQP